MGFEPLDMTYIRMCHEMGLGKGDPDKIEVVGEDISEINFQFKSKKSIVIWGDQMIRTGFLRPFEKFLLHTPLIIWAPFASNVYHDCLWYPTVGRKKIRRFLKTEWGELWRNY